MKRCSLSFVCICFCFLFSSCKKENLKQSISLDNIKSKDAPNYDFNWETATAMPVSPSSTYDPPMPWQSQSGSYIDAALVSDYKSNDGWVLVYNTFNPTVSLLLILNQQAVYTLHCTTASVAY
jgi:hypothetical protein